MGCRPHARAESGRHVARSADGVVMSSVADAARLAASHGRRERRPTLPLVKGRPVAAVSRRTSSPWGNEAEPGHCMASPSGANDLVLRRLPGGRGSAGMLHGFEVRHAPGGRHSIREFRKYPDRLTGEGLSRCSQKRRYVSCSDSRSGQPETAANSGCANTWRQERPIEGGGSLHGAPARQKRNP